jgi:hypothetical protein
VSFPTNGKPTLQGTFSSLRLVSCQLVRSATFESMISLLIIKSLRCCVDSMKYQCLMVFELEGKCHQSWNISITDNDDCQDRRTVSGGDATSTDMIVIILVAAYEYSI